MLLVSGKLRQGQVNRMLQGYGLYLILIVLGPLIYLFNELSYFICEVHPLSFAQLFGPLRIVLLLGLVKQLLAKLGCVNQALNHSVYKTSVAQVRQAHHSG